MKRFINVITISIILSLVGVSRGQVCAPEPSNDWTGLNVIVENGADPGPYPGPVPPGDINTFIMTGQGSTNCYGVVAEWRAEVEGGCVAVIDGAIDFEVWRKDGVDYLLVGFNTLNAVDCEDVMGTGNEIRLRIPENARIPIEDNNFIGWSWHSNVGIREVNTGTSHEGTCLNRAPGAPPCTGGIINPNRNPVLEARLVQGPAPTIDNLDRVIEVYEGDVPSAVPLFTVLASHPSSQAREAGGGVIVDPATAVLFTFTTAGTTTEFTFTPGANNIGQLAVGANMQYDFETTSQYLINITVTAMGQTDTGLLTVNILDKNEAHDINLNSSATASVQDPTCRLNPIFTVTYSDDDDPLKFPAKKFYILGSIPVPPVGSSLPFLINEDDGRVFCTAELATWTTAMGNQSILDVSVTDGLHSVKGKLTVDIVPTHDPPTIDNLPATHPILEDLAVPTIIFDVDASGSFPADIRFSMEDVQPRQYFNYFSIDEITGEVSLTSDAVLDYVLQTPTPSFTLTVGVRDSLQSGTPQELEIDLIWVNQKPFYSQKEYFVTIPEHCNYQFPCNNTPYQFEWLIPNLTLNIIDRDYDNGLPTTMPPGPDNLTCDILPSFGSSYFTNHHQSLPPPNDCSRIYQQYSIDIDDFPENQQINLTVFVKDSQGVADNAKGDVATIYITITDLNDNNPVFTNPPYTDAIAENTPGGVSLFTVTATDKDHGLFGEVTYSLLDDDSCDTPPPTYIDTDATLHFEIDEKSGLVQTKQFVNYEALSPKFICFLIVATDGGGRSSTTQGIVTITNVNDVRPKWECNTATLREFNSEYVAGSPCFYNDELRPDVLIDYHVLTILSTDGDSANTGITYHLLQPSNYFSLGEENGEVRVNNYLDTYVKYILYCYSQDNGSPSLQSQPHLRVRLDTYNPKRQLVNIVIEMLELAFDQTQQAIFLVELRNILDPWFPKIEITHYYPDKSVVSIYALRDNSTFDDANLPKAKQFVDRDELLDVLRKNLHGTPKDVLLAPEFDPFGVILVEPTYPVWLVDTIPGIITLTLICLLLLALLLGLILGLCSRYNKCCFKKKPKYPKKQWPPEEKKPKKQNDDYDRLSNHSADDRPLPRERRGSIDTIHSLIYNPRDQ